MHQLPISTHDVGTRHGAYLPHWIQCGALYHVVFRLADSLPARALAELAEERATQNDGSGATLSSTAPENSPRSELPEDPIHRMLDAGHGKSYLRDPLVAEIVAGALRYFEGKRYKLHAWCVMPNHVHVIVEPSGAYTLTSILHSWKSFTGHRICKLLSIPHLWQPEYYDRIVRDEIEYLRTMKYVVDNPIRAGLENWEWVWYLGREDCLDGESE